MKEAANWCSRNQCAGTLPARKEANMSSKLTLSIAVALALSAIGGVARANPIPTSTDEARALYGQATSAQSIDPTAQANAQVTRTDDAPALAGESDPAASSTSIQPLL